MNRFDKPRQYDYSFDRYMPQFYTPDIKLWAGVMDQKQKEDAAMEALLAKMPKHIETQEYKEIDTETGEWVSGAFGDTGAKLAYVQKVEGWRDRLTEAALKGDKKEYSRLMMEAQRDLNKDWAPGGAAETMNRRAEEHEANMAAINEAASKDIQYSSVNLPYAMSRYRQQVGQLKPGETGKYIGKVNIYPFLDVQEKANDFAKKLGLDKNTVKKLKQGPGGIYEITEWGQGVSPDDQKAILGYINSPMFRQQMDIEKFQLAQSFGDPEVIKDAVSEANEKMKALRSENDFLFQMAKDINAKKPLDDKDIQRAARILEAKGMFSPLDVDLKADIYEGGNLNSALFNFINTHDPSKYEDFNTPGQYLSYLSKRRMENLSKALLPEERGYGEEYDKLAMLNKEHSHEKSLKEYEIRHAIPNNPVITETGDVEVTGDGLLNQRNSAFTGFNNLVQEAEGIYKDYRIQKKPGLTLDQTNDLIIDSFNKTFTGTGDGGFQNFANLMKQNGIEIPNNTNYHPFWSALTSGTFQERAKALKDAGNVAATADLNYRYEVSRYVEGLSDEEYKKLFPKLPETGMSKTDFIRDIRSVNPKTQGAFLDAAKDAYQKSGKNSEPVIIASTYAYTASPPSADGSTGSVYRILDGIERGFMSNPINTVGRLTQFQDEGINFYAKDGLKVTVGKTITQGVGSEPYVSVTVFDGSKTVIKDVLLNQLGGDAKERIIKGLQDDYRQGNINLSKSPVTEGQKYFTGSMVYAANANVPPLHPISAKAMIESSTNPSSPTNLQTFSIPVNNNTFYYTIRGFKTGNQYYYNLYKLEGSDYVPVMSKGGKKPMTWSDIGDIYSSLGLLMMSPEYFEEVDFNNKRKNKGAQKIN